MRPQENCEECANVFETRFEGTRPNQMTLWIADVLRKDRDEVPLPSVQMVPSSIMAYDCFFMIILEPLQVTTCCNSISHTHSRRQPTVKPSFALVFCRSLVRIQLPPSPVGPSNPQSHSPVFTSDGLNTFECFSFFRLPATVSTLQVTG